jgi:predicted GNAT family acetyltransferase
LTTVADNPERSRYEIRVDDEVAGAIYYRLEGDTILLDHTEVEDRFEGQGIGSKLARGTLDDVRSRGLRVLPHCGFVRSYISRHDEYVDLVPEAERARFDL